MLDTLHYGAGVAKELGICGILMQAMQHADMIELHHYGRSSVCATQAKPMLHASPCPVVTVQSKPVLETLLVEILALRTSYASNAVDQC